MIKTESAMVIIPLSRWENAVLELSGVAKVSQWLEENAVF